MIVTAIKTTGNVFHVVRYLTSKLALMHRYCNSRSYLNYHLRYMKRAPKAALAMFVDLQGWNMTESGDWWNK